MAQIGFTEWTAEGKLRHPRFLGLREDKTVSVPLDWAKLMKKELRSDGVTIANVFDRLENVGDPWRDFWLRRVSLSGARKKLEELNVPRQPPQKEEVR